MFNSLQQNVIDSAFNEFFTAEFVIFSVLKFPKVMYIHYTGDVEN